MNHLRAGPSRTGQLLVPRPGINLARIDLVSMWLVLECVDHGTISAAAGRCHMSVMAASERLRRLEDSFGKPLFHRNRHGLVPTEAGTIAAKGAQLLMSDVERLVKEVGAAAVSPPVQGINPGRRGKLDARINQVREEGPLLSSYRSTDPVPRRTMQAGLPAAGARRAGRLS
jgi:DNA-binding transcriptional LysR family regulator